MRAPALSRGLCSQHLAWQWRHGGLAPVTGARPPPSVPLLPLKSVSRSECADGHNQVVGDIPTSSCWMGEGCDAWTSASLRAWPFALASFRMLS